MLRLEGRPVATGPSLQSLSRASIERPDDVFLVEYDERPNSNGQTQEATQRTRNHGEGAARDGRAAAPHPQHLNATEQDGDAPRKPNRRAYHPADFKGCGVDAW